MDINHGNSLFYNHQFKAVKLQVYGKEQWNPSSNVAGVRRSKEGELKIDGERTCLMDAQLTDRCGVTGLVGTSLSLIPSL
jgi:hypothetical protein